MQRIAFLSTRLASLHQNPSADDQDDDGLNLLLEVMELEYPAHFFALKQALAARRLVVILDGFDEGAGTKKAVLKLVTALERTGCCVLSTNPQELYSAM